MLSPAKLREKSRITFLGYDNLHIFFPFCHLAEPSKEQVQDLEKLLLD